jgi:hypothetical protein
VCQLLTPETNTQMPGPGSPEASWGANAALLMGWLIEWTEDEEDEVRCEAQIAGAPNAICDMHARNMLSERATTALDWRCMSDGNAFLVHPIQKSPYVLSSARQQQPEPVHLLLVLVTVEQVVQSVQHIEVILAASLILLNALSGPLPKLLLLLLIIIR